MSEDQRVARFTEEPPKGGPAGAERWAGYLDWVRGDLATKVLQRWLLWGFLGEHPRHTR